MFKISTLFTLVTIGFSLIAIPSHAQVVESLGTIKQAKSVVEFYKMAIQDPQDIIVLKTSIHELYLSDSSRYRGLNNQVLENAQIFPEGPLSLDHIDVRPAPSPTSENGYFSITVRELSMKDCVFLANYRPFFENFTRIILNGDIISNNGTQKNPVSLCHSSMPFTHAKNELTLIAY